MTIQFKCSACQAPLRAPDEMAGRKAKCRQCGAQVSVPNPAADRWPPGMAPPGETPKPSAPRKPAESKPKAPVKPRPVSPARPATAVPTAQSIAPESAVPQATAAPKVAQPAKTQPPQAVPIAVPVENVAPVITPMDDTPDSPIDDISALLDFEKAAPRVEPTEPNPYQSPQTESPSAKRPGGIIRVGYSDVMRTTWGIFSANLGACVGATVIVPIGIGIGWGILFGTFMGIGYVIGTLKIGSVLLAQVVVAAFIASNVALMVYLTIGYFKFILHVARGKPVDLMLIINSADLFWPACGVMLLSFLAIGVGMILLVIPGLIIAILLWLAPVALVDKEEGVFAALSLSAKIMMQNLLPGVLLIFPVIVASNVLSAVTVGLGGLLLMPIQVLMLAVIYLRATGRKTAID